MALKIVDFFVILGVVTAVSALPAWTPVPKTSIASEVLIHPSSTRYLAYHLPSVIPSSAKAVLIFVTLECGRAHRDITQDVQIFTEGEGGYPHYVKYIYVHSYNQDAWNTSSENMWFPMPANRKIFMQYTRNNGGCLVKLYATGYY